MPARGVVPVPDLSDGSDWALAQSILHAEDPATYGSWFHALEDAGRAGGRLTLRAPSRFHAAYVQSHLEVRLQKTCRGLGTGITDVVIVD